jgi:dienelactone hydrolase
VGITRRWNDLGMRRHPVRVLLGVAIAAAMLAACAVVPTYSASTSTFEGFPVISYVPANVRGIVFVFHGTGGSADFATKIETVDMLNHLVADGYGFVSTESTDRNTDQWDTTSLSLTANADLARLSALYASFMSSGKITDTTPIYAVGMSRGAGFASVFAQAFKNAGDPVAAIAPSHGQIPIVVRNKGGLNVPAIFTLGANDTIVDNAQVIQQVQALQPRGISAEYFVEPETNLQASRFLRIPGIGQSTADAIFTTLTNAGLWNQSGQRLKSINDVEAALPTLQYPANVTGDQKQMLADEINVVLAVHQYSATYATQTTQFFDAHR